MKGIDRHHIYYPRKWYKTKLEKKFRNHPDNVIFIDKMFHRAIHLADSPPPKPSADYMRQFLDRHL